MGMTEWEKLQRGELYDDSDQDLFDRRVRAKKLFRAYNVTTDEETEKRKQQLDELFAKTGENIWIEPDFRCEYGSNIEIEDHVYINFDCVILDCARVHIGAHSLLGPHIGIYAVNHALDPLERLQGDCMGKPITIGNNIWIGGDTKILAGVTIGDNTVIGAGSVVTKDIPANVVAVGNPCRVIRKITEEDKQRNYSRTAENFQ